MIDSVKDGEKTTTDSDGWFCNCCNMRIRRNPRTTNYKAKLRSSNQEDDLESQIDLSYFNKRRAIIIKKLANCILKVDNNSHADIVQNLFLHGGISDSEIQMEFNESVDNIINLAYTLNPPNKISMIVEFERIKSILGRVPTKQDIDENAQLNVSQYEDEFESWEHMLERLEYDPWYNYQSISLGYRPLILKTSL